MAIEFDGYMRETRVTYWGDMPDYNDKFVTKFDPTKPNDILRQNN